LVLVGHITCQPPSHGPTSPSQTARPLFVPKCFPQTSLVQTTLASPGLKSYAGKIPKLLVRSWCWPLPLNIPFLLPPLLAQSVRLSHRTQLRASTCSHGAEVSCLQDKPLAFHGIFLFRISPKDPRSQLWHCCPCSAVSSRPQTMVAAGRGKCHGNKPA